MYSNHMDAVVATYIVAPNDRVFSHTLANAAYSTIIIHPNITLRILDNISNTVAPIVGVHKSAGTTISLSVVNITAFCYWGFISRTI